jgi:hypothetical protein
VAVKGIAIEGRKKIYYYAIGEYPYILAAENRTGSDGSISHPHES